ncbi:MAG: hypothetical protein H7A46_01705 [Verrucomicrobiales bacterium]|nr:hypothetical protein [Verrucomicrobiales bacterium]
MRSRRFVLVLLLGSGLSAAGWFIHAGESTASEPSTPPSIERWWERIPAAQRQVFGFEDATPGRLPSAWQQGCVGEGRTEWKVLATDAGQVLAQVQATNPNRHFNVAWTTAVELQDGLLSVRLRPTSGKHDQGGGLVWRLKDAANYYVVRANPLEDNVVLYKMEKGVRTDLPLVEQGRTYGMNVPKLGKGWHTLAVDVKGDLFTVLLDGKPLYRVRDTTFPEAGHAGLWTKADAATGFDDFTIIRRQ